MIYLMGKLKCIAIDVKKGITSEWLIEKTENHLGRRPGLHGI